MKSTEAIPTIQFEVGLTLEEIEKRAITETLKKTNGNRTLAAEILGVSIRTIRNKLKSYNQQTIGEENG